VASQTKESVTESAATMATQAGEKMEQAVEMAKHETVSLLEGERERVAESLYTTAHALRQAGQQLREQEQESMAALTDRVAQRAETASSYLRDRDLSQIIDDTEQLGRAHPMLFIGAAFGLGVFGVRFLKSSRRQQAGTPPPSEAFQALNASRPADSSGRSYTEINTTTGSSVSVGADTLPSMSNTNTSDWVGSDYGANDDQQPTQVVGIDS